MGLLLVVLGGGLRAADGAAPGMTRVGRAPLLPAHARATGTLPDATSLPIAVALKPRDLSALEQYASAVSTPGSGSFRRYLSVAGFRARFGPTSATIAAVRAALQTAGLTPGPASANGLLIPVTATAGQLSRAFALSFRSVAVGSRTAYANTAAPALPATVAPAVQGIIGLDSLGVPRARGPVRPAGQTAHRGVTAHPAVMTGGPQPCAAASGVANAETADEMASAYDFSGLYGQSDFGAGQKIGLFEMEPYLTSDVAAYQSCYGTSATVTNVAVDGGAGSGPGGGEAILDIDAVLGLAPKATIVTYTGPNSQTGLIDTYNAMASDDTLSVISNSWFVGSCDPYTPAAVTSAETNDLLEAAVQGQSYFAASGDVGSDGCYNTPNPQSTPELGDPIGQSYVTDVGGTSLTAIGPPPSETTWNDSSGAGSGGISAIDTMPDYQLDASPSLGVINTYSTGTRCGAPAGEFCREAPDVSAVADPSTGYAYYLNGAWGDIGGTSASSPLWAALTALTNASAACHGTNVGFINPILYQLAGTRYSRDFHDVTTGNIDWAFGYDYGGLYPAGPGYDLATGLGTPDGANLAADLCAGKQAAVTVTNPGPQSTTQSANVSLAISATDTATGPLTYAATGLPAGLAIAPSTGVISGSPTTAGSSTVTVTVTDVYGAHGTTTFGWQVTAPPPATTTTSSTPAPAPPTGPTRAACPAAGNRLHGAALGPVVLGATRAQLARAFPASHITGTKERVLVCLTPVGTHVDLASAALVRALPKRQRSHWLDRVVLAISANPGYAVGSLHPGARLGGHFRPARGTTTLKLGSHVWYLATHGQVTTLVAATRGVVTEVGIASAPLVGTKAQQRRLLNGLA